MYVKLSLVFISIASAIKVFKLAAASLSLEQNKFSSLG